MPLELEERAAESGEVAVSNGSSVSSSALLRLVLADEPGDGLVVEQVDAIDRVRGDEAVEARHGRQQHVGVLGDLESDDRVVVGLLRRLGEQHDPAGIAGAHGVAVVAVDVDRRGQRAVRVGHDDGQAHAGGDVELLPHERETLARRRRHDASAGGDAPMHALIAECSDSTVTYSVCTRPCATNLANSWTMVVCGVIG